MECRLEGMVLDYGQELGVVHLLKEKDCSEGGRDGESKCDLFIRSWIDLAGQV
jgi:hypothetical protein